VLGGTVGALTYDLLTHQRTSYAGPGQQLPQVLRYHVPQPSDTEDDHDEAAAAVLDAPTRPTGAQRWLVPVCVGDGAVIAVLHLLVDLRPAPAPAAAGTAGTAGTAGADAEARLEAAQTNAVHFAQHVAPLLAAARGAETTNRALAQKGSELARAYQQHAGYERELRSTSARYEAFAAAQAAVDNATADACAVVDGPLGGVGDNALDVALTSFAERLSEALSEPFAVPVAVEVDVGAWTGPRGGPLDDEEEDEEEGSNAPRRDAAGRWVVALCTDDGRPCGRVAVDDLGAPLPLPDGTPSMSPLAPALVDALPDVARALSAALATYVRAWTQKRVATQALRTRADALAALADATARAVAAEGREARLRGRARWHAGHAATAHELLAFAASAPVPRGALLARLLHASTSASAGSGGTADVSRREGNAPSSDSSDSPALVLLAPLLRRFCAQLASHLDLDLDTGDGDGEGQEAVVAVRVAVARHVIAAEVAGDDDVAEGEWFVWHTAEGQENDEGSGGGGDAWGQLNTATADAVDALATSAVLRRCPSTTEVGTTPRRVRVLTFPLLAPAADDEGADEAEGEGEGKGRDEPFAPLGALQVLWRLPGPGPGPGPGASTSRGADVEGRTEQVARDCADAAHAVALAVHEYRRKVRIILRKHSFCIFACKSPR